MRIRASVTLKKCIVTGEYDHFSEIDDLIARCRANGDEPEKVDACTINPAEIKQGRNGGNAFRISHPAWNREE